VKVCVYGAGAVGGALAVRLHDAGVAASIVARGAHGQAIRERGLTLLAGGATHVARLHCVEDADELEAQDVVFVTVKQTHLPAMAGALARMQARGARLVFAMNGIPWWFADELPIPNKEAFIEQLDPGGVLRGAIDTTRAIGAAVLSSNEIVEPGVVLSTTPKRNRIIMGNVVTGSDNRIPELAAMLERAGYGSWETRDIRLELWNKMVLWLAVSPMSALTGLALDKLVSDPGGYAVMAAIMRETIALGRRLGFDLADETDERIGFYRDKPTRPSLLKDFELGREPELASGVLVFDMLARALDHPAPHIAMIAALTRLRFEGIRLSSNT
jgi:2-dehydropantoate 2-reductase